MARSMTKAQRFRIFTRDAFICQYCGRRPPAVILEVDHVLAVSRGGGNDDENLITSCFDCNRGKGAGTLESAPIDYAERAAAIVERREQVAAYEALLANERAIIEAAIDEVEAVSTRKFPDTVLTASSRLSVRQFLTKLPKSEVIEAMEIACDREDDHVWKYFCGVCWRKIKGD